MHKNYDPKCYDLAAVFLSDHSELNTHKNIDALAQTIQDSIEAWIEVEQNLLADDHA